MRDQTTKWKLHSIYSLLLISVLVLGTMIFVMSLVKCFSLKKDVDTYALMRPYVLSHICVPFVLFAENV
jgi:hypothetical protein